MGADEEEVAIMSASVETGRERASRSMEHTSAVADPCQGAAKGV